MKSAQIQKDEFETLCRVKANISNAPYTSKRTASGDVGYKRDYDVILLVGLTELKAQVSWIDSKTVRAHLVMHASIYLTRFPVCANPGDREEVCSNFFSQFFVPRLNPNFRSNAVVVYDDPSEGA